MSDSPTLYDVVDGSDNVVGQADRDALHTQGLLHRGVNVLFYRKDGNVILQRRSPTKNTFPNKLDVTAGGHVDSGDTYERAAMKEVAEETGLQLQPLDLQFLLKVRQANEDRSTGTISNYFCAVYAYNYEDDIAKLVAETNKGVGFELHSIAKLLDLTDETATEYTNRFSKSNYKPVLKKLNEIMK